MILKMCSIGFLVDNAPALLRTLEKVHLSGNIFILLMWLCLQAIFCIAKSFSSDQVMTVGKSIENERLCKDFPFKN